LTGRALVGVWVEGGGGGQQFYTPAAVNKGLPLPAERSAVVASMDVRLAAVERWGAGEGPRKFADFACAATAAGVGVQPAAAAVPGVVLPTPATGAGARRERHLPAAAVAWQELRTALHIVAGKKVSAIAAVAAAAQPACRGKVLYCAPAPAAVSIVSSGEMAATAVAMINMHQSPAAA
jgi:hypothetical protein